MALKELFMEGKKEGAAGLSLEAILEVILEVLESG
jgi:hypothetical protein